MKTIAIIGHRLTIELVEEAIKASFEEIETAVFESIDLDQINAAIEYIKAQSPNLDGIVFTGKVPSELVNRSMSLTIPHVYVPHDQGILQRTLLASGHYPTYDIGRVSVDSYTEKELKEFYDEFDYDPSRLELQVAPMNLTDPNFLMDLFVYHQESHKNGKTTFAMTGITTVYERLMEANVPCLLLRPTKDAINNAVNHLLLEINSIGNSESQIVVIAAEIDLPNEYNLIHENEYQRMLEKTRVTEEVYKFAEKIQGAVVETGPQNYMLFTTRQILESETDQMNSISVLGDVIKNTTYTLSMGIGYGKTAREAKYNAALSLNKALTQGGNQAYFAREGKLSAPIYPLMVDRHGNSTISDPLYKVISEASGISVNNIYRLQCIIEKMKKDCFTSGELSKEFGNTRRSMNRIIEKLEKSGYASIEGARMMSDTGRPTRIIRLQF